MSESVSAAAETEEQTSLPQAAEEMTTVSETGSETQAPPDITPPVIEGVQDIVIHVGEQKDFLEGITAADDTDPEPLIEADYWSVDNTKVGSYIVIYIATDKSGNSSYSAANVKVVSQESISREQADEMADSIFAELFTEGMTDGEKLYAIWWYIYGMSYSDLNYGTVDDYLDNAYHFLDGHVGDDRCFYSAARLLLERAGYQTMTVQNVPDAFSEHYWNLVSCDGGNSWYHFDAMHWSWLEDGMICMATDEQLWNYSARHDYETHDWDTELYPATPEEDFPW